MGLPLYSTSDWKVQHFLLVWDFRLVQSDFASAHVETGLWVQREWSWVTAETFEGLTLLRYKWKNAFNHAVPRGSETSWQNCSNYVFLNAENQLCFIFLLLSENCSVTVQTSVIFISFIEIACIYLLEELDTLWPSKGAQLILNLLGQRRRSNSEQSLWHIFVLSFD